LRSDGPVKIGDDKYVALCIARDFQRVVPCLESLCCFTYAMPNERGCYPAPHSHVSAGKMNDGDHPVFRIAETKIWHMVAHGARLFAISTRRQHDDGHVSVGCRMLVSVDINEANRISFAG